MNKYMKKNNIIILGILAVALVGTVIFILKTKSIWSKREVFYAYILPNESSAHIVDIYQPEIEFREIDGITYPFIKGTKKMLVKVNVRRGRQWVLDYRNEKYLPKNHHFVPIQDAHMLPESYRNSFFSHNSINPYKKEGLGKIECLRVVPKNKAVE